MNNGKKRPGDSSYNIIFLNVTSFVILLYCWKCVLPLSAVSLNNPFLAQAFCDIYNSVQNYEWGSVWDGTEHELWTYELLKYSLQYIHHHNNKYSAVIHYRNSAFHM